MKLFEGEYKVMQILWMHEGSTAKDITAIAEEEYGWNKNTTYTVIRKLVTKGYIDRQDPGFICHSLVSEKDVQLAETRSLIDRLFHGSKNAFISCFLQDEGLKQEEREELLKMIEKSGK